LDEAPPEWSGPLVLRVYPGYAEPSDVRRECLAQQVAAAQGVPAPRVVACEPDRDPPFMVMERLVGRPQMVIAFPSIFLEVPRLFTLPRRHAKALNLVHSLDAAPLAEAFAAAGIDGTPKGWLDRTDLLIERWRLDGLRPALEWLRSNAPPADAIAICHGDLFGANILERRGRITGIIDWALVTVTDPAFDLGGQLAAYEMSATPGPYVFQLLSIAFGRLLAWGLRGSYRKYRKIPRATITYYSVMRAFTEMTFKLALTAEMERTGETIRLATWRPPQCARYIRRRTGVRVTI
jgi:aminoglycoside phosphotransferase (APT) family kinase protein